MNDIRTPPPAPKTPNPQASHAINRRNWLAAGIASWYRTNPDPDNCS